MATQTRTTTTLLDSMINTFRSRQDTRLVIVVWRPNIQRFELWWTDTTRLTMPCQMIMVFAAPTDGGMIAWTKTKAQAVTFARGLSAMTDDQFGSALLELRVPA